MSPNSGMQALSDDLDVRIEKINLLRAAISTGKYSVSPEEIADKLMQHMLKGS